MAVNSCLSKFAVKLKQQKIAFLDMHRICYIFKLDHSICSPDISLHDILCVCTRVGSNNGVRKCICPVSRLLSYMLSTTATLMYRANRVYQVSLYHCIVPAHLLCCSEFEFAWFFLFCFVFWFLVLFVRKCNNKSDMSCYRLLISFKQSNA